MKQHLHTILFGLIAFVIVWFNRNHFFFWDTIQLTSMHAHWFYEGHFSTFFLPTNMDSGHPPFWGMYHAGMWMIFGKSLTVSHLSMSPFIFGSLFFAKKIGEDLDYTQHGWLFGLFLLADPVFLTQASLVSPDVALSCFFLMTLYGILRNPVSRWAAVLGAIGLAMISMRGMMTLAGLGLFLVFQNGFKDGLRKMLVFIPGIVVGMGFLIAHSLQTKWVGYHADSPWAESFQLVGIKGFLKNIAVLIWRNLDLGRVYIWILLGAMLYKLRQYKVPVFPSIWLRLLLALSITLLPTFLFYKGLNTMRYLMPLFIIINLFFVQTLLHLRKQTYPRWVMVFVASLFVFMSGHFWKSPDNIAVAWDSTLRHLPYYELRKDALSFMKAKQVPLAQTATFFPNTARLRTIDLNANAEKMIAIEEPSARYYFISNVYNDMTPAIRSEIETKCTVIFRKEKRSVWIEVWALKTKLSTD